MGSKFKKILSFFPVRYYAAGLFFAFIFLNTMDSIASAEEYILVNVLNFMHIPSFISNGNLFVGEVPDTTRIAIPMHLQVLFFIFFATIITTARTNFGRRARMLGFGFLNFFVFIFVEFAVILGFYGLGIIEWRWPLWIVSIAFTIFGGALVVDWALFSTITIPKRTKVKPMVKRRYTKEYLYLITVMSISGLILFGIEYYLRVDIDSPFVDYVHLYLWLNISSIVSISYWVSNLIHTVAPPAWLRKTRKRNKSTVTEKDAFSVSFLIPAYNEERIVGRCIESIDRAAAKYPGKVEVILVNDGSADNTEKVVTEAIENLKYATGKYFKIPNSGKGFALVHGMDKTIGDIIFRTDADSVIDENALTPMMNHFKDPQVGSVCGWVYPLEGKGVWFNTQSVLCANFMYVKRAQELFDSILIQPGSSTAFRKEALMNAGGWVENIFGEDGEITNRVARYGYRGVFEASAVVYSEHPQSLLGLMQQRARWGVAFYHSRGRNLNLAIELRTPRALVFLWNVMNHGGRFGRTMVWPYLAASIITVATGLSMTDVPSIFTISEIPWVLLAKLAAIQATLTSLHLSLYAYRLRKVNKLHLVKYYPVIRLVNMILNMVVKPNVMEILLSWSTKWKTYNTDSFKDLRRIVKSSVDPLYPDGEEVTAVAKDKDTSKTSGNSSATVA